MTTILKGENKHFVRRLLQPDGSPLLRTALGALQVELWQGTALRTTYVYGTAPELVANPGDLTGNEVRLEITTTLSNSLPAGKVTEIWQFTMTDSAYVAGARVDRLVAADIIIR